MKTKLSALIILFVLVVSSVTAQTKVRDMDIVNPSGEPYIIYIICDSVWIRHDLTYLEFDYGWEYNKEINFDAKKGTELNCAFVACSDTTFISIKGGRNREVVKGGSFVLDGGTTMIGY